MIAELGTFSLILALVVSMAVAVSGLWGAARRDVNMMAMASIGMVVMLLLGALAFGLLTDLFVTSDFTAAVVYENSHTKMPLFFRIAAVWGNHEGSMLLWVMVLSLFGASIALFGSGLPPTLRARVLGVQGLIMLLFLTLMLFTSNPFARLPFAADEGRELNPLLQDVGLAVHPPFLYLGYVGFSVTFAFAVAALIEGKVDASWARFMRPWVLAAWCFLTIGITLGSSWAYYELGWGGWWYWDPVENASFMPWLVGTALLHSALVVERRGALVSWTVLLAILTYSMSLIGTFLVRSGVLTSVHSFAADPNRGFGILLLLGLTTGGALTLYAARARSFGRPVVFSIISREGGLVLNNILLLAAVGTVFLGTFYPLFVELISTDRISVGPPFFNSTFGPLMLPLLFSVVVGTNLRWKRDTLIGALKRGAWVGVPALLALAAVLVLAGPGKAVAAVGLALASWLILGTFAHWASRVQLFRGDVRRSASLALHAPRSFYGMLGAHLGLGIALLGIIVQTTWSTEAIKAIAPGEVIALSGYDIRLDRLSSEQGANYEAERATFVISRNGTSDGEMSSERRFYPASGRQTTEAAIRMRWFSNLYIAIGEGDPTGHYAVRAYYHPLVFLIWFGPLLMAAAGAFSLSDRRFRVGAPAQRSAQLLARAEG